MPIVIMPNGEMVDSTTGNPVDTPRNRVPMLEGDMARFISNVPRQRSMDNLRANRDLTVMQKMQLLMDMGLTEGEALDAIAMEESAGSIEPQKFGNEVNLERPGGMMGGTPDMLRQGGTGMGALGGVPMGGQAPMAMPTPRPTMEESMGADRTMNPMDRITSRNAPST